MKRQIPQVIQEGNVYIDGIGYLGVTKKLKLPTIEFEMIESKGALSTNYTTGMLKATEVEFTVSVLAVSYTHLVKIDEVRLIGLKDHKLSFKVVLMSGDEIEVRA